ncbi:ROK family protein, partial [Clostridium sp.]|uniref:ROK family protein n=1 Tax=Clostridium sp. TaxID=1506 RepID=UPI003F2F6676
DLTKKNYVIELGVDNSNGGRRATRYSLNYNKVIFLMIWLRENLLIVEIRDICKNRIFKESILIENDEEKIAYIEKLVEYYNISLVYFSVEGIIKGYRFMNDITFTLTEYTLVEKINDLLEIPVFLENDVRLLASGHIHKNNIDARNAIYMYIGTNGMGAVIFNENNILRGENNYAGEIGLIQYKSNTINNWLMSDIENEELEDLIKFIITIVAYSLDPSDIIISSDFFHRFDRNSIEKFAKEGLVNKIDLHFTEDYEEDLFYGIHYYSTFNFFQSIFENTKC